MIVISLYDAYSDDLDDDNIALQCLDLWDAMYEKQMGMARELTKMMMDDVWIRFLIQGGKFLC